VAGDLRGPGGKGLTHPTRPGPDFIAPEWTARLALLDTLWDLEAEAVETPNRRRGGWSEVIRHTLPGPDGKSLELYVKRQSNYVHRSWQHPLRGTPTCARELKNLLRCRDRGVPAAMPVYYATRRQVGAACAMLVTEALSDHLSLALLLNQWYRPENATGRTTRRTVIPALAVAIRALHQAHLQHNALYPKHMLVRVVPDRGSGRAPTVQVRLIDLEKAKRRLFRRTCTLRDLDTLNRHTPQPSGTDRLRFLKAYLGGKADRATLRALWRALARRAGRKPRHNRAALTI